MTVKIQLSPDLRDNIRTLVHDALTDGLRGDLHVNEQKNRQKIEQLAMKIRAQLDQLTAPK